MAFGRPAEAGLIAALRRDGDAAIALVAEDGRRLLGHILLSPMRAPFRALGLAPLAVHPDHQRRGIGTALVQAGLDQAREEGWDAVFLLGGDWYRRFGFSPEAAAPFASPYSGPHFMMLALTAPLPAAAGEVAYAPAFASLG